MQTLRGSKHSQRGCMRCRRKPTTLPSLCPSSPPSSPVLLVRQEVRASASQASRPTIREITQMRMRCFLCLSPSKVTGKQALMIFPTLAWQLPPHLPNPLEEHPGHYEEAVNESVAWPVVMRHILDPFNRAWETLDRQPANRLCNRRTQPCQACQGSASP